MGSMSIAHWLIVLVVIMLVFGTKKLGSVGSDLGKAIKGFNDGIKGDDKVGTSPPNRKIADAAGNDQPNAAARNS